MNLQFNRLATGNRDVPDTIPYSETESFGVSGFEVSTGWQPNPFSGRVTKRSSKITQMPTVQDLCVYPCGALLRIKLSSCSRVFDCALANASWIAF